jgi:hypothetical protein
MYDGGWLILKKGSREDAKAQRENFPLRLGANNPRKKILAKRRDR